MNNSLQKLIREIIEREFLCEVKIDIEDIKKRGFADQIGQMYKEALADLKPIKIKGKIGTESAQYSAEASVFEITLKNGDIIHAVRSTNPAYGIIIINKDSDSEVMIKSQELFRNKFPDLIKKHYLEYKTAKAGIPSI